MYVLIILLHLQIGQASVRLGNQKSFRARDGVFLQMTHTRVRQKLVSDLVSKFVGKPPRFLDSVIRQPQPIDYDTHTYLFIDIRSGDLFDRLPKER